MSRTHAAIWALVVGALMLALEAGWALIFGWHWFEPSYSVVFAGGVYTGGRIASAGSNEPEATSLREAK